jgi:hypothetical protein
MGWVCLLSIAPTARKIDYVIICYRPVAPMGQLFIMPIMPRRGNRSVEKGYNKNIAP